MQKKINEKFNDFWTIVDSDTQKIFLSVWFISQFPPSSSIFSEFLVQLLYKV